MWESRQAILRASERRYAVYVLLLQDMAVIRCVLLPNKMKRSFGRRGHGSDSVGSTSCISDSNFRLALLA